MPPIETAQLMDQAISASREAGALLLEHGKQLREVDFQDAHDVKLRADRESEALIRDRLAISGWPVIGEEEGGDASLTEANTPYWVVDPLDGTYNYLRQQPLCCVSIGLMQGLKPLLGVIYDFNSDTLFTAESTKELHINGQPGKPVWPEEAKHACLMTGFPVASDFSSEALGAFITQVQQYKKIRMIGSAALAIAYVASGKGDVYKEEGVRLWDLAGGLALIEAAGAKYTIEKHEKPLAYTLCVAGREEWLI